MRNTVALTKLNITGCTKLTNDTIMFVNAAKFVKDLAIVGCTGINSLKLNHVEILRTDLVGVSFLECPEVKQMPMAVSAFQTITWATPKLEELTLKGISLTSRELTLMSDCSNLATLSFLNCRLQNLDVMLRRLRKLLKLSLHSCKGVTDADVSVLCSTIEVLDLTDNYCLTDKVMAKIADFCRNLSHLTLKRCSNVTDRGLLCFEKSQNLQYLNVLGAKKVTVLGLHRLISAVPSLEHVVHESLVSTAVRIDREDDEETQMTEIKFVERNLVARKEQLALSYVAASPSRASPRKPQPPVVIMGGSTPSPKAVRMEEALAAQACDDHRPATAETDQVAAVNMTPL